MTRSFAAHGVFWVVLILAAIRFAGTDWDILIGSVGLVYTLTMIRKDAT